jgi:hypothetical protein
MFIFKVVSNYIPTFKRDQVYSDVVQYYSFVTATFECKDLSYKSGCPPIHYSLTTKDGRFVNKRTVGMAYMYTPLYLVSQTIAKFQGREDDGYSKQTQKVLVLGMWFYLCIGLFVLGKAMFRYFSYPVVAFCLLALILCTNLLWYYAGDALFTHSVNFMWMSILIYATMKFHDTKKLFPLLFIALSVSLLTIIRPNNILLGLFPVLYGVYDKTTLLAKIQLIRQSALPLALALLVFLIPIIPQFIYWKYATGQWIYYSYGSERFFWLRPMILDVLISYRKGWFIYTPFMLLIIPGFIFLKSKAREMFLPIVVLFPLFLYVTSCWWAWSYGGSFGMRPLIDIYPLLIFCIAAFLQLNKWYIWIPVFCFAVFCGALNLFQSWQYHLSLLHWDQMNKKTYWSIWRKEKWPLEYDLIISYPDYSKEELGESSFYTLPELTEDEFSVKFIRSKYICSADTLTHALRSDHKDASLCDVYTFKYNAFEKGFTVFSVSDQRYWRLNQPNNTVYADEQDLLYASVFQIESMGHNKFVFKAPNGKYIVSGQENNFLLKAEADKISENSFVVIRRYLR